MKVIKLKHINRLLLEIKLGRRSEHVQTGQLLLRNKITRVSRPQGIGEVDQALASVGTLWQVVQELAAQAIARVLQERGRSPVGATLDCAFRLQLEELDSRLELLAVLLEVGHERNGVDLKAKESVHKEKT